MTVTLTDSEKLLVLAAWFDMWDRPEADRQAILDDNRNPGRNGVQRDLRRIAASLADPEPHFHDWGDAEYATIKAGRADCVDPHCPDRMWQALGMAEDAIRGLVHEGWSSASQRRAMAVADRLAVLAAEVEP